MPNHTPGLSAKHRYLLDIIADEPFTTLDELEGDPKETKAALKLLLDRGLIAGDTSYKATRLGHLINNTL